MQDNTKEHCYVCFEEWQIGDGMVRLRYWNYWLYKDCLSYWEYSKYSREIAIDLAIYSGG
jgi:hypothetical protein